MNNVDRSLLKLSSVEPNVGFFSNFEWKNYRWRVVGERSYYRPLSETFHDFLDYLSKLILGKTWWKHQMKLPKERQHIIYQWANEFKNLKQRSGIDQREESDGSFSCIISGNVLSWLMLGYDLLCLFHKKVISAKLIGRLKNHDYFQGARYEVAVASLLIRASCDIEWISTKSLPQGKKSCELIATHKKTNIRFGIEAKSKKRPGILNEFGSSSENFASISKSLKHALKQAPDNLPFVIFLDLNIPFCRQKLPEEKPILNEIKRALGAINMSSVENPDSFSYILATSFGFHYGKNDAPAPLHDFCEVIPNHTKFALSEDVIYDIRKSVKHYGNIPDEI